MKTIIPDSQLITSKLLKTIVFSSSVEVLAKKINSW